MSFRAAIKLDQMQDKINAIMSDHDACLVTKSSSWLNRFDIQGLNEALEVPKEVPVYTVNEVRSSKFPTFTRYNVTRKYKDKTQSPANFKSKSDADEYAKQKNEAAAGEVSERYKLEQMSSSWIYVRDTRDQHVVSSVVAKFSTKHESLARDFLKRINAE